MFPYHSCYICGTWRSRGRGFSHHPEGTEKVTKKGRGGGEHKNYPGELSPQLVYLNYLPI